MGPSVDELQRAAPGAHARSPGLGPTPDGGVLSGEELRIKVLTRTLRGVLENCPACPLTVYFVAFLLARAG